MATSDGFSQIDTSEIARLTGIWQGYLEGLQTSFQQAVNASVNPDDWKGDRSTRFYQWWDEVTIDVQTLTWAVEAVYLGLQSFLTTVQPLNTDIARATAFLRAHATDMGGNQFSYQLTPKEVQDIEAATGQAPESMMWYLEVQGVGFSTESFTWPSQVTWLPQLKTMLEPIAGKYRQACQALATSIQDLPVSLRSTLQLKLTDKNDPYLPSTTGLPTLHDPTWTMLVGIGVFRPTAPKGMFIGDPFTEQLPDWYDPPGDDIFDEVLEPVVILTAAVLTATGNEEAAPILIGIFSGSKTVGDILEGHYGEAVGEFVNIPLAMVDAPGVLAEKILAAAGATGEHTISQTALAAASDYLRTQLQDGIEKGIFETDPSTGEIKVPTDKFTQLMLEANERLGVNEGRTAAGLPAVK